MFWPLILHLRGLVHSYSGHPDRGLALIDEAVALVGSDDFPDIWISRGGVMRLLPTPDLEGAEGWYRDAIEAAKQNDCGHMSCRPWTRLVDLRRARGVSPDGSDELRAVCDTFTEHDLAKARTVLGLDPVGATSPR